MTFNKTKHSFTLKSRLLSFKYAINGLLHVFKTEHNARIHAVAAVVALVLGWFLKIEKEEWFWIILAIGVVFMTELINSAFEYLANVVSPGQNEKIGKAKDLSAAAVLVAAIISLLIGSIIFIPKLLNLFA